jgi:hypothetical protein
MQEILKEELIKILEKPNVNLKDCMKYFECGKTTIKNKLKHFSLTAPKGFYSTGKKIGKPKGSPMPEHQKRLLSKMFSKEGNPYYGKRHSDEIKQKMRDNHADFTGDKNPFSKSLKQDENKRILHKQRCLKIWKSRDEEYRNNVGQKLSKALAESNNFRKPSFHKKHKCGHYFSNKCGVNVFYRSSWEHKLCRLLDHDKTVLSWSLEEYCIKYEYNDKIRYTRIDFLITYDNNIKKIIEIKPKGLQNYKNNKQKIEAMKKHCEDNQMLFEVFSLEEIENYERFISFN